MNFVAPDSSVKISRKINHHDKDQGKSGKSRNDAFYDGRCFSLFGYVFCSGVFHDSLTMPDGVSLMNGQFYSFSKCVFEFGI